MHAIIIFICISEKNKTLSKSPFWGILTIIEVIFFLIAFVRIFALVVGVKLAPLSAGAENVILFAVWVALLFFRYVAYQGVLMTWVSPEARENRLNQHLLASLRERDKLLQKLTASNRQLGASALAGAVAHQLSQPLTGAALQAAALKRDTLARGEVDTARRVERISNQIEELSDLLRDMRSLFSAREEQYSRVEMADICNDVLNLVESSHGSFGITFKRSMISRSCIMGNAVQIQQVIINIMENSVQALSSTRKGGGLVEFIMSDGEGKIEITISDNGKGFDPEYIDHVFDIYYTTKDDGVGIGLWICRQIVEKHGGSISVSNRDRGGGCVSLTFPVADVRP